MARVGRQMIPSILADTIYVETQPPANRLEVLDWYVLAAYGLLMLGIGWYFSRRTRTVDDYLLGGRQMRSWTVGLSLFATLLSTISYLATPGEIIRYGPMIMSGVAAIPLIILIVGWVLIPAIMMVQVTTAYEILELHLVVSVRVLGSTFFQAQRLIWMALIIYATTSKVLVPLLQWPPSTVPYVCLALGLFTVVYTTLGGLRAVVWTDAIQTFILFSGAILSIVVITSRLGCLTNGRRIGRSPPGCLNQNASQYSVPRWPCLSFGFAHRDQIRWPSSVIWPQETPNLRDTHF